MSTYTPTPENSTAHTQSQTPRHSKDDALEAREFQLLLEGCYELDDDYFSLEAARAILGDIQLSIKDYYSEWLDMVGEETVEIVHEDKEAIVFADHSGHGWREELDAAGVEDDVHRTVIKSAHHKAASELTDYSWSASDPFVFSKSEDWQIAEQHVRRTIAKLARESGSVARGVDRWAVERQDMRLKEWGDEHTGTDRPHQTISKNARRGREEAER